MEIFEAIFTRRSIRKYTGKVINDVDLKCILKSGFYAPSAKNIQPWHFIVVKEPKLLEKISQIHPYAKMLPSAGCCIVVCGDKTKQRKTGFLIEDCSASIENMLLAAHGLGLGAVWLSLYPIYSRYKPIGKLLNVPATIIPVGMIALGYKAEDKSIEDRYSEEKLHFEKW